VQAPLTKAPAWLLLPPEWLESTARNERVRRFLFATDAIYECVPANTNPEAKWSSRRRQTAPTPAPTRWLVRQWCSKDGRLQRPGKKCQDCQENKKQKERVGIFFVREKKKLSGKKIKKGKRFPRFVKLSSCQVVKLSSCRAVPLTPRTCCVSVHIFNNLMPRASSLDCSHCFASDLSMA
jgi:hypothetical protein